MAGIPSYLRFYGQAPTAGFGDVYHPVVTMPTAAPAVPTLTGGTPTDYNPAVGGKPAVPDPMAILTQALDAYRKNLPAQIAMANQVNAANQEAAVKQITDLYPQFKGNVSQLGTDIGQWAQGRLSDTTKNAIIQAMQERGVAGGFGPDSPSTNAALMRLLGTTSEDLISKALTGQNVLLGGLPHAPLSDATKFGVSPTDIFGQSMESNLLASLYKAAPNPADAYNLAMSNLLKGLGAGGAAGTGPFAGTPGTATGTNEATLQMLRDLINRPMGGTTTGTTAAAPAAPASTVSNLPTYSYTSPGGTSFSFAPDLFGFGNESPFATPTTTATTPTAGVPVDFNTMTDADMYDLLGQLGF